MSATDYEGNYPLLGEKRQCIFAENLNKQSPCKFFSGHLEAPGNAFTFLLIEGAN